MDAVRPSTSDQTSTICVICIGALENGVYQDTFSGPLRNCICPVTSIASGVILEANKSTDKDIIVCKTYSL